MHVPDGWRQEKLGKISTTVTSGSRDWAQFYSESGSKFIRMTNLRRDGIYLKLDDLKYVDVKSDSADGKRTALENGDILISITAELGKIGWIPENFGEAFINQHTALVRINQNKANSKFIAYLLLSRKMNAVINQLNDAGAKAGLNLPTIKALPLLLPPLHEQQKIAQILSTWNKAIEKLEALIAAKQKRKKALMQQLLTGKKRFAGFDDIWPEVTLGTLFKEVKDKVGTEQVIPHSITAGTGFVSHEEKWGKDISGLQYANYTLLRKGQFSYNKGNSKKYACGCMYLLKHVNEIAVPNVFISFERRNKKICNEFFEQYFMADYCARELRKYITSGARSDGLLNLNKADFFSIKVPLPGFNEQQKIASVLTAADTEIETQQKQLAALKEQKKGLMQQLLTGKKRVRVGGHV